MARRHALNRPLFALLLTLGMFGYHDVHAAAPPEVKTGSGAISGQLTAGSTIYRGIPYALPPTGELRWRPPQDMPRWQGTRAATQFGAPCPQHRRNGQAASSENCLSLNVAAPAGASGLPVLFSIHGGGFVGGSGAPMLAAAPLFNSQGISLPEETAILFAQGRQHPVPFMAGGTSFDGSSYPASGVSAQTLMSLAAGSEPEQKSLWRADYEISPEQANKRFFGDIRYLYSAWNMTRSMAKVKQPGYLYLFDYLPPEHRGKVPGASHGSDASTLWGDYSSSTAATMRSYWLNFIKTGNPNATKLPTFAVAAARSDTHWMVFAPTVAPQVNAQARKMNYLDRLWRTHANLQDGATRP